jgi:hypothetical protein
VRDCGGGRTIFAAPACNDVLGAAFFNGRCAIRIIAGGMFTIAGAIMVSTSAALTHAYGRSGLDVLEALGGVSLIAGALLTLLGLKDILPADARPSRD